MPNSKKANSFSELCDQFIKSADQVVGAQMDHAKNSLTTLWSVIALETCSQVANFLSAHEKSQRYQELIADKMAGFLIQNAYAGTLFELTLGTQNKEFAEEARGKGLHNLAKALEMQTPEHP